MAFGPAEVQALTSLRELAAAHPVDMTGITQRLEHPAAKAAHKAQMTRQSIIIPFGFMVTFSIETGHPVGTCRHMSMSSPAKGRVPSTQAVDMVAEVLGFIGGHQACMCWIEDLDLGHGTEKAINLVQVLTITQEGHA